MGFDVGKPRRRDFDLAVGSFNQDTYTRPPTLQYRGKCLSNEPAALTPLNVKSAMNAMRVLVTYIPQ